MRVFITGASGWIGSAVVPQLVDAGHQVVGLARSEESAAALAEAGVEVRRGTIDDLDTLRDAARASDGVIHLAYKHELIYSGDYLASSAADRRAIEALGDGLAGTGRPLVIASGVLGIANGRVATEHDGHGSASNPRLANAQLVLSFAQRDIRSSVVRLAPTVHGAGDHGFMAALVGFARERGVSGHIGDGRNRWTAVHRLDAARLFHLALESAPAGTTLHGVAEEGVPIRAVAEVIGRHLDLPVSAVAPEDAAEHFAWLAGFLGMDSPASSEITRELLGWQPSHPGLIEDLEAGHYFRQAARAAA